MRWSLQIAMAAMLIFAVTKGHAKTIVFCSEGSPEALNPQFVSTTTGMNATRPIFDNLVEFEPGTTRVVPGLAKSWTVSPDGLEYIFSLREEVSFHSSATFRPTRKLTADDVVFSFLRQWRADHPYHRVSNRRYDYFDDLAFPDLLESVEKVDPLTVRIRLKRPEAPFLANLALSFTAIHSAEYAETLLREGRPEALDTAPIGTGPFAFEDYRKDVSLRYSAFADHWRGREKIDNLVFAITPNAAVRLTKLRAGECHVMAFPNPADVDHIAADPALRLLRQEGLNVGYMALNVTKPPLDDLRVRRAINMAVDKAAIVEAVYGGAGVVAKNPIPPTMWSYNDDVPDDRFDPARARELLTEAGLPDGFETELWYMPVSRPYNPNGKRMAEMIQVDLRKLGIRLRLKTDEWSEYRAKLQAGMAPMALFGWTGDNGDPDNFLNLLLGCTAARPGGNNIARWCDSDYDRLVNEARRVPEQSVREDLYRKAQVIVKREAPWVPLAHSVVFMATRKDVTGFYMDPLGRQSFTGVDLR